MSYARARRRYLAWERYVQRTGTRSRWKFHMAHSKAFMRCVETGRAYPRGVRREPWVLVK